MNIEILHSRPFISAYRQMTLLQFQVTFRNVYGPGFSSQGLAREYIYLYPTPSHLHIYHLTLSHPHTHCHTHMQSMVSGGVDTAVCTALLNGRLQSLDWTGGLDWWTGLVD